MTWSTAIQDLRTALSDNDTDKFSFRKKVFGIQDGINTIFKTFDSRRVTDFTSSSSGLGVFINSLSTGVSIDDVESGFFTLPFAPSQKDRIEATYYHRWFNDTQLQTFLRMSSNYIGIGDDYTQTEKGLQPIVIKFSSSEAYQELSVRFARMLSEQFRAEDLPKEALESVMSSYDDLAKSYRGSAEKLLKNFYTRQGRSQQPIVAFKIGRVRDVAPNR